jgi:pyruvate dehydrogenase E2 component (dihydrolipoamide acetyltransferase)
MAQFIRMTALSPTMDEGTVQKWNVAVNDKISTGDVICEVETDKANMDYEAEDEGVLLAILVEEGGKARVGDPIAIIGEQGEDISALKKQAQEPASLEPAQEEASGRQAQAEAGGRKPAGAERAGGAAVAAAGQESRAGRPGGTAQQAPAGQTVQAEQPAAVPGRMPAQAGEAAAPAGAAVTGMTQEQPGEGRIKISPLANRIAAQNRINIAAVRGSGPGGRIIKRDIEKIILGLTQAGTIQAAPAEAGPAGLQEIETPVSRKRAVIARRLAESKFSAPHYYLGIDVLMDELLLSRQRLAEDDTQGKLTLNTFLIKLAAEAIKKHPLVNSTWMGDTIVTHGSIDIGLAVDREDGLVVPVVRNCGARGLREIDTDLRALIEKARAGKLTIADMDRATFTISNLGSFGIDDFTAIINPPGSAILAVGKINKRPWVNRENSIEIRQVLRLTLSCDHRVLDGAAGARFLNELKNIMEQPVRALL